MNVADKYFIVTLKDIKKNGQLDDNPRPKYEDGTLAYSKFITQVVHKYNVLNGEFPITTLRNGSIKSSFNELKTIYIDQSNKDEDFKKNKIYWWTPWMNSNGDLGTAYSWNLESGISEEVIKAEFPSFLDKDVEEENVVLDKSIDDKIYQENTAHPFIVVNSRTEKTKNGTYKYTIQFINTGYKKVIRCNDMNRQLKNNIVISDPTDKDFYGKGYIKDLDLRISHYKEYIKWKSMIKRCYNGKVNNYFEKSKVSKRWLCFDNFIKDLKYIPNYFLAKRDDFNGWELDKDYYSDDIKIYSKHTCTFLPSRLNKLYAKKAYFSLYDSESEESKNLIGYETLEKELGVKNLSTVFWRLRKKGEKEVLSHNGKIAERVNTPFRYKNSKNQVNELLFNLANNKFSRRHMLSFYNWPKQDDKQLVECAFQSLFSVSVKDGVNYLDQTLVQRSSDVITAGMINCSQYVMLGMIIANHMKYVTGEEWKLRNFTWFVQNVHIYDRHFNALEELLERKPLDIQPTIELVCKPKDFYSHTIEDFKFNVPKIEPLKEKLEIAI